MRLFCIFHKRSPYDIKMCKKTVQIKPYNPSIFQDQSDVNEDRLYFIRD